MKKCKRIFHKRIFPFISAFMVLISALVVSAPSASAVDFDYNDYIQNITVDGDNDIVIVSFPLSVSISGYPTGSTTPLFTKGNYERFYLPDEFLSSGTWIRLRPIGGNRILTKNIPNGTLYRVSVGMDTGGILAYDTPLVGLVVDYFKENYFSSQTDWIARYPVADFEVSGTLDIPNDVISFRPEINVQDLVVHDNSQEVYFYVDSFELQMTISSLYRLQQEVGETNEILEAVKAELIAQGTTLDEVLVKLGVIEANQRDILSTLVLISTNLWEWFSQTWTKLENGFQSIVSAIGSGVTSGLNTITTKVEQIVTGQTQTNDSLDEIINGGEIVDPGISDDSESIKGGLSDILDFEDDSQQQLTQDFDVVLADFDGVGNLAAAFAFIGDRAGTVFVSLGDYSFVLILPIMIGIFFTLAQHVPRGVLSRSTSAEGASMPSEKDLAAGREYSRLHQDVAGVEFSNISAK